MEITDIRVRPVGGDGKLKAYAAVTFDDSFVVHNIKVIHGRDGTFIAMPSRRTSTGDFRDVAHPITSEFRHRLQDAVLEAWQAAPAWHPGEELAHSEDHDEEQLDATETRET